MNGQEKFFLLLLLSTLNQVKPDCRPVQEGQETALTCTVNTAALACPSTTILDWTVADTGVVALCSSNSCDGHLSYNFSTTINNSGSTLTITNVSRTDPFNMETKWSCRPCRDKIGEVTACDKLEVYYKPQSPRCTVRENTAVPGDVESVTVSCSTTKVYPEAKCSFKRKTNQGGTFLTINKSPTYSHTPTTGTPAYYNSECSVDVSVAELGEGTHSFSAFIYPDVTDGIILVDETAASTTVTLTVPEASYTCSTNMIQGYLIGKSARCTCSLTSDGYPKGQAQWYRGSQTVPGVSGGVLNVTFDSSIFEENVVTVDSPSPTIDLCGETNYTNNHIPITCRVPKDKIYPPPLFSVSQDGLTFDLPREGHDDTMFHQTQFYPSPDAGGVYQATCRVKNKITGTTQERETPITYRKPPPQPPKIIFRGETYQGVNALNRITLAAGYTGDMTCRVEGGYPKAHTTQLTCGLLNATGEENVATLKFQDDQLNEDMSGTECRCTSQHVSGCYDTRETSLIIDVTPNDKNGGTESIVLGFTLVVVILLVIIIILVVLVLRFRKQLRNGDREPAGLSLGRVLRNLRHIRQSEA